MAPRRGHGWCDRRSSVGLSAPRRYDGSDAELAIDVDGEYPTDGSLPTYAFEAREGQVAVGTMRSLRPEVLDPLVRVDGPDGELIGMDDDGAGWPDARLTVRLPCDGRYEIEADTFLGEPRGAPVHTATRSRWS